MKIELTAEELKAIQLSLEMRADWLENHGRNVDAKSYFELVNKIHEARHNSAVNK